MSRPALPVDALKLATDLNTLIQAGKKALIAQDVIHVLTPYLAPGHQAPAFIEDLLWLLIAILQGSRVDYRPGGLYSPQEVRPLYPVLKLNFDAAHPIWDHITIPTGETLLSAADGNSEPPIQHWD